MEPFLKHKPEKKISHLYITLSEIKAIWTILL